MVAIEDARFYEHGGLDVQGTAARAGHEPGGRAACRRAARRSPSSWSSRRCCRRPTSGGASGTAATEQTLGRKLREARLALALEDDYSKDELLTRYLNIVYFGQNAYGVQPAARAFFGVDAAALTLTQAALLAGLVQSPADDDPFTNPEGATIRRNQVLDPDGRAGLHHARRRRPRPRPPRSGSPRPRRRAAAASQASVGAYVCDFVQKYLTQTLGISQDELEHDGYVIQTTLDPELQRVRGRRRPQHPAAGGHRGRPRSPPCSPAPGTCWR